MDGIGAHFQIEMEMFIACSFVIASLLNSVRNCDILRSCIIIIRVCKRMTSRGILYVLENRQCIKHKFRVSIKKNNCIQSLPAVGLSIVCVF